MVKVSLLVSATMINHMKGAFSCYFKIYFCHQNIWKINCNDFIVKLTYAQRIIRYLNNTTTNTTKTSQGNKPLFKCKSPDSK